MYAVREWPIDFVEQSHINNARNWMAAVCHEIKETVSLYHGERCEQWGRRPAPPCSKCEKIHVRKASPGETGTEQGGSEGKQAKCDSSDGKGERKREKLQHLRKAEKKIKTQDDIRHAFFDPTHGSRIRLSAASLTNPFQAPILRQEVDHDPMPMDAYDGSSEQSRCDIVATNSSALSPRDLPPLQLKANLPLQLVELVQMQTDERSQHSEELFVDKDTFRPRVRAPSPWYSKLVPCHESNTRASGLRHDVFNRIGPLKLDHQTISPGSSALRSRNAPNPRKGVSHARPSNGDPSPRHCTGIFRLALKPRRSALRLLQHVSSLQAVSFRAGNSSCSSGVSGASVAPAAAVDHFNPRTDLAPVITMVAASTASNVSSVVFAACCSGVGAGGEVGSGGDGSGDYVIDTSDSGAGGSASGITHTRGTGNSRI